jgi:hypothetical protein
MKSVKAKSSQVSRENPKGQLPALKQQIPLSEIRFFNWKKVGFLPAGMSHRP